jgi:hypothetical protein
MVGNRKTFGAFIPFGAVDVPTRFKASEAQRRPPSSNFAQLAG